VSTTRRTVLASWTLACALASPARAQAGDRIRLGVTTTLANDGFFNYMSVAAWSPGADLRIAVPLAVWTSVGAAVGYQHVVRIPQLATDSVAPWNVGHLWLEWSAYAPLAAGRLELGERLALGWAHAFTSELQGLPAVAIHGTAAYWVTSYLAPTLELGASMTLFATTNDPEGSKPWGLGLVFVKAGALIRF
jgi:hypothetical protein